MINVFRVIGFDHCSDGVAKAAFRPVAFKQRPNLSLWGSNDFLSPFLVPLRNATGFLRILERVAKRPMAQIMQ